MNSWASVIPQHMRDRRQWVEWGPDPETGRPKCPLIIGSNGRRASSTDPTSWRSYAEACARYAIHAGPGKGVGYVFTADDGLVFLDFDHALDDAGEPKAWALPFVEPFLGRTYVERSPSGRGLHVFVRGAGPETGKAVKVGDGAIEVYTRGRYSTITGDIYKDSNLLDEAPDALERLLAVVAPRPAHRDRPPARVIRLDEHRDYKIAGDALRWLDPDIEYAQWLVVGQALHSRWPYAGSPGFVLWDYWSARGQKYPGSDALARKWRSFVPDRGITLGSLIHISRIHGARHHHG